MLFYYLHATVFSYELIRACFLQFGGAELQSLPADARASLSVTQAQLATGTSASGMAALAKGLPASSALVSHGLNEPDSHPFCLYIIFMFMLYSVDIILVASELGYGRIVELIQFIH